MGIPLVAGRAFTPQDFLPSAGHQVGAGRDQPKRVARTFFQGSEIRSDGRLTGVGHQGSSGEIVGIVGDTKFSPRLRSEIAPNAVCSSRRR